MRSGVMLMRLLLGGASIVTALCLLSNTGEAQPASSQQQIRVAVFELVNLTGEDDAVHWQALITTLLKEQLAAVKMIRVLPNSSERYAQCELAIKSGQALTAGQALKAGQLIDAQHVVWGDYQREGGAWRLSVQHLDVSTGKASPANHAASSNWFQVTSVVGERVLAGWGLTITAEQKARLHRRATESMEAAELVSRAVFDLKQGGASLDAVKPLRRALALDPKFARARLALGPALFRMGEIDEATAQVKAATNALPDLAQAHLRLGEVFLSRNILTLAEEEFQAAAQLDPTLDEPHWQLGVIYSSRERWDAAVASLKAAAELAPHDALGRAALARAYRKRNDRQQALIELKAAERLRRCDDDPEIPVLLARSYETLGDLNLALRLYEQALAMTETNNKPMDRSAAAAIVQRVSELETRVKPNFVTTTPPKSFTTNQLESALAEKLTAQEREWVEYPLASSPALDAWAQKMAGDIPDKLEKARRLFVGIKRSNEPSAPSKLRSAREAFRAWSDPKEGLDASDYTYLFVAAARAIGLSAHVVLVGKDYEGRSTSGYCAGIFIDNQALLLDFGSRWFGAAHQGWYFMNDLEVVGAFLAGSNDQARENAGLKLVTGWAEPYFWVTSKRIARNEILSARAALQAGLALNTNSRSALLAQVSLAFADQKWAAALTFLEQLHQANSAQPNIDYYLGYAYQRLEKLAEARVHYRRCLESGDPEFAPKARQALSTVGREQRK